MTSVSHTVFTPVGPISVTSTDEAIVRVEWRSLSASGPSAADCSDDATTGLLAEAIAQLRAYFDGTLHEFDLPVSLDGVSPVARSVLTTLHRTIEYGTTVTYGELAVRNGQGVPARAIGGIMGSNPLPILIPCHRVVASTGLGGYSGGERGRGLETKRWLLEFEGGLPRGLF
ncbi:methylated-DNA--[protein]-cysteine S-methyltransferase [Brevibacterium celere]|uniref:methylated-DNA--[protein]-cysteine S-methyltransferase n=1 Tax=Brevibacterium TaxID=1696 RepID=UPI003D16132C